MACKVTVDPTGDNDFVAPANTNVTICFSSASGSYKLTEATYAGQTLTVNRDSCVSFKVAAGTNLLNTTAINPNPTEPVHVSEDCGDGTNGDLGDFPFKPVDGFTVVGL